MNNEVFQPGEEASLVGYGSGLSIFEKLAYIGKIIRMGEEQRPSEGRIGRKLLLYFKTKLLTILAVKHYSDLYRRVVSELPTLEIRQKLDDYLSDY